MRKVFFVFFIATTLASGLFAQEEGNEKIEALKTAFITQELSLTPQEAQAFWPLYNEFHNQIKEQNKKVRLLRKKGLENMTSTELEALVDAHISKEAQEAQLKKEFVQKLKKVLPILKIAKLQQAENEFRKRLLDRMREKRG